MTVTWRDGITLTVEVAFASAPLATTPTWTDISAYVKEPYRITHGTTSEDGDTVTPSSLSMVLKNRDRRFDPDHATGPYFGNLVPRKRIRVTAALGAFSAVIFTGWINGWPQQYDRRFNATAQVTATSSWSMINSESLPSSAYAGEVIEDAPTVYYPLQGSLAPLTGYGTATFATEPTTTPAAVTYSDITAPVGESQAVTLPVAGALLAPDPALVALPTTIEAWVNVTSNNALYVGATMGLLGAAPATTFIRFGINPNGDLICWYSHAADNLSIANGTVVANIGIGLHHVVMARSGTTLAFAVDGSQIATKTITAGTQSTIFNTTGYWLFWNTPGVQGAISHFATYNSIPAAIAATHYNVGRWAWTGSHGDWGWEYGGARIGRILDDMVKPWPANLRDLDTGGTRHGAYLPASGNPVTAMSDVARGECGMLFNDTQGRIAFVDRQALWTAASAATFSDDGAPGAVKFNDISPDGNTVETIRNIVVSTYDTGTYEATLRDATSVDAYGSARQSDSTPTLAGPTDAVNRSLYVLRNKKDPTTRITRLVVPISPCSPSTVAQTTTQVTKTLALQIASIVTAEVTPMGVGAQVVKRCVVVGIQHDIDREKWWTTLYLSPAPTANTAAPYLTLGDATYGRIGAAAANKLPY